MLQPQIQQGKGQRSALRTNTNWGEAKQQVKQLQWKAVRPLRNDRKMPWSVIMDSGEESQRIREQSTREWKIKLSVEDAPTEYCTEYICLGPNLNK